MPWLLFERSEIGLAGRSAVPHQARRTEGLVTYAHFGFWARACQEDSERLLAAAWAFRGFGVMVLGRARGFVPAPACSQA